MDSLLVGIDASKELFSVAGIDSKGNECFSRSYSMDSTGFDEFLRTITSHCEDLSKVIVGMESTGCYHINLYSFLTSRQIHTLVINPLLIANYAKLSLRKTKTDKKDARTIAKFLLDHRQEVCQLSVSQDLQDLRDLSRERESLCHPKREVDRCYEGRRQWRSCVEPPGVKPAQDSQAVGDPPADGRSVFGQWRRA